jgi:glycerol kinase
MRYIAAIDQGTTSTRLMVFNGAGEVLCSAQREHRQWYPAPGWVEHDPVEIIENIRLVAAEALIKGNLTVHDIAAVGITNQRETTVVWNKHTGQPYHNAIVWQDTRTQPLVQQMTELYGANALQKATGLPFSTYFSSLKLVWLLNNVAGLRQAAEAGDALFGTIDTWLLWTLTGEHKTDVTNASRTQLMNLSSLQWDDQLLALFNIPRQMLPAIQPSAVYFGTIAQGAAKGTPVMSILGDQQAALVGQTCFEAGEAKNTYGTGCFMLMNTGNKLVPSSNGLLTTVAYDLGPYSMGPQYALEGSIAVAGSLVQWLRDNLGLIAQSPDVEALANTSTDNGGVYIVPAFSGLYAPYWRPDARGTIVGLTGFAHKGHLARAVLEATAYQSLDVLQAMQADSGIALKALNVDGGMVSNQLLMQFQADMAQVPVQCPLVSETTCLGAAYAAGLAAGYWQNLTELKNNHRISQRWLPAMAVATAETLRGQWKKAVEKSMGWAE